MIRHRSSSFPACVAWLAAAGCLAPITSAQTTPTAEAKVPRPLPHMEDVKTPAPAPAPAPAAVSPRDVRPSAAGARADKPAETSRPAQPIDFSRVHVDQPGDGTIWAHGETYKASADGRRFTYVPFFGSKAPRNFPVAFELASVSVGGEALALFGAAAPRLEGESIVIDHGPVDELYELAPRSVEQQFVFDALPRRGDVVVRLQVESELALREGSEGFELGNELGRVRYGKATAIDAAGRTLAMETTWADGELVLSVPSAFVADARFPLTIDPVITTFAIDTTAADDAQPDVAFDASTGTYAFSWERVYSATDHDVWIEHRDAAGNVITLSAIDFTSSWWAHPRIATNALASQFLVVAAVGNPSSGARRIWGREREAEAPYTLSAQFQISDPAVAHDQFDPDVGGDPELLGPTFYCVVWTRHYNATDRDVFARLVTPSSGVLGSSHIYLDNSGATWDIHPSISKSDGHGPFTLQDWNIVWQREPSGGNAEIRGAQIHWDGIVTTPSFAIPLYSVPLTWPSPTPSIDIGGSRCWLVALEANYGDHDIVYAILNGSTILDFGSLSFLENDDLLQDQVRPAAETDGRYFTIAYSEQFTTTTLDYDIWASSLFFDFAPAVLAEDHRNLAYSTTYEIDPQITSRWSGGDGVGTGFGLAWLDFAFGGTQPGGNIEGGLFGSTVGGPSEYLCFGDGSAGVSCPCGGGPSFSGCPNSVFASGAQLYTTGDASVGADSLVLNGVAMPNATAVYFQGTTSSPAFVIDDGIMCTGGTVIRIGSKLNAGNASQYPTSGDAPVSVRGAIPAAAGVTRVYQCFYRNAASFCTSATSNRTNAVRVTWLP